jgi:ribonuclease Z
MIGKHHGSDDFTRGMHVIITGSSSALPDPERGNASAAVAVEGHLLQFDCGRGAMEGLCRVGINPLDVDCLFFTHLHFDHIATYGYFVISSWMGGRQTVIDVYGPSGTQAMSTNMIEAAHAVDVAFIGHVLDAWPDSIPERPLRDLPVRVTEVEARGLVLETPAFSVRAVETPHYREMGIISFGYRVDSEYGSVVVTGDGRPSPQMVELARGADLIVHECAKPDPGMISSGKFAATNEGHYPDLDGQPTGGHTTPRWLGEFARNAEVKKVVVTHLPAIACAPAAAAMSRLYTGGEVIGEQIWDAFLTSIRASFAGEVVIARDGMVFRVGG